MSQAEHKEVLSISHFKEKGSMVESLLFPTSILISFPHLSPVSMTKNTEEIVKKEIVSIVLARSAAPFPGGVGECVSISQTR